MLVLCDQEFTQEICWESLTSVASLDLYRLKSG